MKSDQRSRETSVLVPLGQLAVSSGTFVKFASRHQLAIRVQVIIHLVLVEAFECGLILS